MMLLLNAFDLVLTVVKVVNYSLMAILPRIIGWLFPIFIEDLNSCPMFDKEPTNLQIAHASRIKYTGLSIAVLVIDIAACF